MKSDQADEDVGRLLYAVENAVIRRWPYPHFLASGLLAADLIDALRALDLAGSLSQLRAGRGTATIANRFSLPLLPDGPGFEGGAAVDRLKRLFGSPDVMTTLMRRFADVIQRRVRTADGSLLVGKTLDLIEDRTGYSLPPHTDGRQKLLTLTVYLDDEPRGASLGTSLYTPKPVAAQALLDAEEEAQRAGSGAASAPQPLHPRRHRTAHRQHRTCLRPVDDELPWGRAGRATGRPALPVAASRPGQRRRAQGRLRSRQV